MSNSNNWINVESVRNEGEIGHDPVAFDIVTLKDGRILVIGDECVTLHDDEYHYFRFENIDVPTITLTRDDMTTKQFYDALTALGFSVWDTGGGCTAWGYQVNEGKQIIISQFDTHEVYIPSLHKKDGGIYVGVQYGEDLAETYNQRSHRTLKDALDHATDLVRFLNV